METKDQAAVGRRVRVFWEGEGEWFEGVVDAVDPESGYFVRYDDGEEQWEPAGGALEFLPEQNDGTALNQPELPSPSYSQHEFEYDGESDRGERDQSEQDRDDLKNPIQELSSGAPGDLQTSPTHLNDTPTDLSCHHQRKVARALQGTGAAFFRDPETLREMKRALEVEKRELTRDKTELEAKLADRERESAVVRRELQQLKTQVSLASALHYVSISRPSVPSTPTEWKQRVMDVKLDNQQLQHDIEALKAAEQIQLRREQEQQQRVDKLRAKVANIPKRELLTLVELQVEIAQALQRKRKLEEAVSRGASSSEYKNPQQSKETGGRSDEEAERTAKEKELARLERSLTQSQEDARGWRTQLECERAKLQPMRERLESLRAELMVKHNTGSQAHKGKGSTLLRSLFLRLDSDEDALVDQSAALGAFALLLGHQVGSDNRKSTGDDDSQLSFDQFVDTYYRVSNV